MGNVKEIEAMGGVVLEDDRFVIVQVGREHFYHVCCSCGQIHRVHMPDVEEVKFRWERIDKIPDNVVIDAAMVTKADMNMTELSEFKAKRYGLEEE